MKLKKPIYILLLLAVCVLLLGCVSCMKKKGHDNHGIDIEEKAEEREDEFWVTRNGFKVFTKEGYVTATGIDVSEFVGDIDWEQAKAAGVEFAILRIGYRGYETARFVFDNSLHTYLQGCNDADVPVGVYFVSQAINEEEAIEEAEKVLEQIHGYDVTMPIYIDLEGSAETARTRHLTREEYTAIVNAFCERIEQEGFRAGVYSNENWIRAHLNWEDLTQWDLWFAKYTKVPNTDYTYNMWQYTNTATIDGIEKEVDLNARVYKK